MSDVSKMIQDLDQETIMNQVQAKSAHQAQIRREAEKQARARTMARTLQLEEQERKATMWAVGVMAGTVGLLLGFVMQWAVMAL